MENDNISRNHAYNFVRQHYVLVFKRDHRLIKKSFAEITQSSANSYQLLRRGILFYFMVQFSSQFEPEFR